MELVTVPFDKKPCQCVRNHSPKPARSQLHHPWPQSDQRKKHGRVIDDTTVPLCGSGHDAVHEALDHWLKNKPFVLGNRYLRSIALEGYIKITGDYMGQS